MRINNVGDLVKTTIVMTLTNMGVHRGIKWGKRKWQEMKERRDAQNKEDGEDKERRRDVDAK